MMKGTTIRFVITRVTYRIRYTVRICMGFGIIQGDRHSLVIPEN